LLASRHESQSNPLGQTIRLLQNLQEKAQQNSEHQAKAYRQYYEWCADFSKEKEFELKTATALSDKLQAKIEVASGEIEVAQSKIEELAADIATSKADLDNGDTLRKQEAADFAASQEDLLSVVDVISKAAAILAEEMQKNPASFAQMTSSGSGLAGVLQVLGTVVDAASLSVATEHKLLDLAQLVGNSEDSSEEDDGASDQDDPPQGAYKTSSGGIVDVLKSLQDSAEDQLKNLRAAEEERQHNFKVLKQSLEDAVAQDEKDMDTLKKDRLASEQDKAVAVADLQVTQADLAATKETLESAKIGCMQVAANHEASVASTGQEMQALTEGIRILNEVTGGAAKLTYSLLQQSTRHSASARHQARSKLVAMVKQLAKTYHSTALNQLASRIATAVKSSDTSGADPFGKVKGLMRDMIAKLTQEAQSEASEKLYCDSETSKTEARKSELTDSLKKLTNSIEKAGSESALIKEEVAEIQYELQYLSGEVARLMKVRQEEAAEFAQVKADLEQGLAGVRQALNVLRDYYAKDDSASFLQDSDAKFDAAMQQPVAPITHVASGDAATSIIRILELVDSDFAENLAKQQSKEDASSSAHETSMHEAQLSKAAKEADMKYKTQEVTALEKKMAELQSDSDTENTELSAVLEYFEKLQERCVKKPDSYEERKTRLQGEIEGLKTAQAHLKLAEDEAASKSSFLSK